MTAKPRNDRITAEAACWPGVEPGTGHRGERAFTVGRHEIRHMPGHRAAALRLPEARQAGALRRRPDTSARSSPARPGFG